MTKVAESKFLWTGIAATKGKRIFVNFPRWDGKSPYAVAEILSDGSAKPYPDLSWNSWKDEDPDVGSKFVCVQSVFCDDRDDLWILDSGNPYLKGVLRNAPKLVKVETRKNAVEKIYRFPGDVLAPASYLNDVRIDAAGSRAYISDSGVGAIHVLDLETGRVRKILADHPSTRAEDIVFRVEGVEIRQKIHCDGIALDPRGEYLYYKALTGKVLYRLSTRILRDFRIASDRIKDGVERVAEVGVCDGMGFGPDGTLWITSLENQAIKKWDAQNGLRIVVQNPEIQWPDSLAVCADGSVYFTVSKLHLDPVQAVPYKIFVIQSRR